MRVQECIGRKKSLEQLAGIYNSETPGTCQLILVGGESGIGKSSFVDCFLQSNINDDSIVLQGKYESGSEIPYSGILSAVKGYVADLLSHDKNNQQVINELFNYLAPNTKILTDFIPELSPLSKNIEDIPELSAIDSHNRFLLVINKFIEFFARKNNKVILYLDDLHRAGKASLTVLESILQNNHLSSVFIIGTYREEEVSVAHPLSSYTRKLAKDKRVCRINMSPLDIEEVKELLAQHVINIDEINLNDVANLVYIQSGGNPLYIQELLKNTSDKYFLNDVDDKYSFKINEEKLREFESKNNIIELLVLNLGKLPYETQELLKLAAGIGTHFNVETLGDISSKSQKDIEEVLSAAMEFGIVSRIRKHEYQFEHDRLKESAYTQVEDKAALHLKIGRSLHKQHLQPGNNGYAIEDIVQHLNAGYDLITKPAEKLELCQLNVEAGISAKNKGAYTPALNNFITSRKLLPLDGWVKYPEISFEIYKNLVECYYLEGEFKQAEKLFHTVLERVSDRTEKAEILRLKVILLTNLGKWEDALNCGFEGLSLYHINIEESDDSNITYEVLEKTGCNELLNMKTNDDADTKAIMSLMINMVSPIYVLRPELMVGLVRELLSLTLASGNTVESAYAYCMYGFIEGTVKGDYIRGNEFARLAMNVNEKFKDRTLRCRVKLTYATNLRPWVSDLKGGFSILESAAIDGVNVGDIVDAGYCNVSLSLQMFSSGEKLNKVNDYINTTLPFLKMTQNPVISLSEITKNLVLKLQESQGDELSIYSDDFSETELVENMQNAGFHHGIHWFFVNKMLLSVIYNNFRHALSYVQMSESALPGSLGQFSVADHNFYHSLILTGLLRNATGQEYSEYMDLVQNNQQQLSGWSETSPNNFLHKKYLVDAELASLNKDFTRADKLYTDSKERALANGFNQDAAICLERHANAAILSGDKELGDKLLFEAKNTYEQWGAVRKAKQLSR